jgi:hypothetical protein
LWLVRLPPRLPVFRQVDAASVSDAACQMFRDESFRVVNADRLYPLTFSWFD